MTQRPPQPASGLALGRPVRAAPGWAGSGPKTQLGPLPLCLQSLRDKVTWPPPPPGPCQCSGSSVVAWASSSLPLTPQPPLSQGKTGPRSAPVPISLGGHWPPPQPHRQAGSAHPSCSQPALPPCLARPIPGRFSKANGLAEVSPNTSKKGPPKDTEPQPPRCRHHHGHDSAHGHRAGGAWGLAETHVPPC